MTLIFIVLNRVFSKWNRNSVNLGISFNLINHWSMNWSQSKDSVSDMCLAGTVEASWSVKQKVADSNPFTVMTNFFVTEFSKFKENIWGKLKCPLLWISVENFLLQLSFLDGLTPFTVKTLIYSNIAISMSQTQLTFHIILLAFSSIFVAI